MFPSKKCPRGTSMTNIKTLLTGCAVATTLMLSGTQAQAANLVMDALDSIYSSPMFNFEGFYAGGAIGAGALPGAGGVWTIGVVAGNNFDVIDGILAGLEFQGDVLFNGGGFQGIDALVLAKLGGYLMDDMVVYGAAGAGWLANTPSYAFGVGVEKAVMDTVSVRADLLGTGSWGGGPNGIKASVGVLWHMN